MSVQPINTLLTFGVILTKIFYSFVGKFKLRWDRQDINLNDRSVRKTDTKKIIW
jgi:hypothetical protein